MKICNGMASKQTNLCFQVEFDNPGIFLSKIYWRKHEMAEERNIVKR